MTAATSMTIVSASVVIDENAVSMQRLRLALPSSFTAFTFLSTTNRSIEAAQLAPVTQILREHHKGLPNNLCIRSTPGLLFELGLEPL